MRTFTPAAAEIYNLRATDTGRPLEELRSRLHDLPARKHLIEYDGRTVAARAFPI